MILPGIEPGISGLQLERLVRRSVYKGSSKTVDRRLIHWATGPSLYTSKTKNIVDPTPIKDLASMLWARVFDTMISFIHFLWLKYGPFVRESIYHELFHLFHLFHLLLFYKYTVVFPTRVRCVLVDVFSYLFCDSHDVFVGIK